MLSKIWYIHCGRCSVVMLLWENFNRSNSWKTKLMIAARECGRRNENILAKWKVFSLCMMTITQKYKFKMIWDCFIWVKMSTINDNNCYHGCWKRGILIDNCLEVNWWYLYGTQKSWKLHKFSLYYFWVCI